MPCFADTILKIKFVRKSVSVKEESDLTSIWAIGKYPVGEENCEIELTLFLPNNDKERDIDTQAIFKKDEFYYVCGKIFPGKYNNNIRPKMTVSFLKILDKVPSSNKCPLKVSLVGVPQGMPNEIDNDENAVFEILVRDYASREYKTFTFRVVYPYLKSRFKYVKNIIRPQESIIFVVGMIEVIEDNFYVYASEINNVDVATLNNGDDKNQIPSTSVKSTRTKLLFTHQNIKNVGSASNIKEPLNNFVNEDRNKVSSDDLSSSKRKRSDDTDEYDDLFETKDFDFSVETKDDFMEDIKEKEVRSSNNINEHQKKNKSCKKKGKVHMTHSSNYKETRGFDVDNKEENNSRDRKSVV